MRYIKVVLLVLIFFFFAIFVVQNHGILGQDVAFRLNLFVIPPLESIPLPLYFIVLIALVLGALVCVLFLAGDRIKMTFALHRANKRINVLEQEVAQLRAIPLTGSAYKALPEAGDTHKDVRSKAASRAAPTVIAPEETASGEKPAEADTNGKSAADNYNNSASSDSPEPKSGD